MPSGSLTWPHGRNPPSPGDSCREGRSSHNRRGATVAELPIACTLTPEALRTRREGLLRGLVRRADFEADLQRSGRIHVLLDDLVQVKRVGPHVLVAERLEAKDPLPLRDKGR
jgi:hypothetical protein